MSYFILSQDHRFVNAVKPLGVSEVVKPELLSTDHAQELAATNLHFTVAEAGQIDYVDYIEQPAPFVSDRLKRIVEKFAPDTLFVPGAFTDLTRRHQEVYWLIVPLRIDCLSVKSDFAPDGSLQRLVVDRAHTGGKMLLQVGGVRERILLMHLALAEALLRRDYNGIRLIRADS